MQSKNPFEALSLLKRLNNERKRTRHLARTKLEPGAINLIFDAFQKIEDQILMGIEQHLNDWYMETEAELHKLRGIISDFEKNSLDTLPSPHDGQEAEAPKEPRQ